MYTYEYIKKAIKFVLTMSGVVGTLWGIYRLIEIIYSNLGIKHIRPAEEFDEFIENLSKYIKEQVKGVK